MTRWTVAAGRDMRGLLTPSIDLPLGVSLSARRRYGSKRFGENVAALVGRIGQHPQMSAPASGAFFGWREQMAAGGRGLGSAVVDKRIGRNTSRPRGKAVQRHAGAARVRQATVTRTAFAHRVGQGDQVVLIGIGGQQWAGVAYEIPS